MTVLLTVTVGGRQLTERKDTICDHILHGRSIGGINDVTQLEQQTCYVHGPHTSHHRHHRVDCCVGGLSQAQAAHVKVDGHLELASNAVVLCACWVLSDHSLQCSHISCNGDPLSLAHTDLQRLW